MSRAPRLEIDATANCRQPGVNPEWFFGRCNNPGEIKRAHDICAGGGGKPACPFLAPCLDYSLHFTVQGYWGATTESQRRKIRKARGILGKPAYYSGGRNNGWVARQMAARGVAVSAISERLGISQQAVRQLLATAS